MERCEGSHFKCPGCGCPCHPPHLRTKALKPVPAPKASTPKATPTPKASTAKEPKPKQKTKALSSSERAQYMREWRQRRNEGEAKHRLVDLRTATYAEVRDALARFASEDVATEVLDALFPPLDVEGRTELELIKSLHDAGNSIISIGRLFHRDSRTIRFMLGLQPPCTTPGCDGFSRSSTKPGACMNCYRRSGGGVKSLEQGDIQPEVLESAVVG